MSHIYCNIFKNWHPKIGKVGIFIYTMETGNCYKPSSCSWLLKIYQQHHCLHCFNYTSFNFTRLLHKKAMIFKWRKRSDDNALAEIFFGKNISNTFSSIKDQELALNYDVDVLMNKTIQCLIKLNFIHPMSKQCIIS